MPSFILYCYFSHEASTSGYCSRELKRNWKVVFSLILFPFTVLRTPIFFQQNDSRGLTRWNEKSAIDSSGKTGIGDRYWMVPQILLTKCGFVLNYTLFYGNV